MLCSLHGKQKISKCKCYVYIKMIYLNDYLMEHKPYLKIGRFERYSKIVFNLVLHLADTDK